MNSHAQEWFTANPLGQHKAAKKTEVKEKFDRREAIRSQLRPQEIDESVIDPQLRKLVSAATPHIMLIRNLTQEEAQEAAKLAVELKFICANTAMSLIGKITKSGFDFKALK